MRYLVRAGRVLSLILLSVLGTYALMYAAPGYFTGWRAALVLFLPLVTDAGCSAAVGLPVYNALHVPGASAWVTSAGALASCAIGLMILDALARWIYTHTLTMHKAADAGRSTTDPVTS